MKENTTILEETLKQIRELYAPAGNDRIGKIQLYIAEGMVKYMIKVQKTSEQLCTWAADYMQQRIKNKGR